eukprot:UN21444
MQRTISCGSYPFENLDFREPIQESYVKTLLRLNQTIMETQKHDIFGFTRDFEQKSPAKKSPVKNLQ